MKKKTIKWNWILFGIGVGILVLILCAWGFLILRLWFREPAEPEVFTGREDLIYKEVAADEDGKEYPLVHSGLLVFPEENMGSINVKNFHFRYINSLDPCFEIFLEYQLDEEEFKKEKARIEKISLNYEGMVQDIVHIPGASEFDTYVTAWGHTYEYALVDEENNKIVCVYAQFANPKRWNFVPEEYKLETSVVEEQLEEGFTLYFFVGKDGRRIVRSQETGAEIR